MSSKVEVAAVEAFVTPDVPVPAKVVTFRKVSAGTFVAVGLRLLMAEFLRNTCGLA